MASKAKVTQEMYKAQVQEMIKKKKEIEEYEKKKKEATLNNLIIAGEKKNKKTTAQIGNWGKTIVFRTSDKRILTFQNFNRQVTGKWAKHTAIKKMPRTEFVGPEQDKVTFTMVLSAAHGVKPRDTLKKIRTAVRAGKVNSLVIGKKKLGDFYITTVSEEWDVVFRKGQLWQASVDVTMEQYGGKK